MQRRKEKGKNVSSIGDIKLASRSIGTIVFDEKCKEKI